MFFAIEKSRMEVNMIEKKSIKILRKVLKKGNTVLTGLIILISLGCVTAVHDRSISAVPSERHMSHFKTYFMKQKLMALVDHFNIVDESGKPQFEVQGILYPLTDRFRFYDTDGNELAFIKQKLLVLKKQYGIFRNEKLRATVHKKIRLFKDKYIIDVSGPDDYTINGNFTGHFYTFERKGKPVAFITKKWFSWGDFYRIEIDPNEDDVLILISAVVIDLASHNG
jgi:uncharacterized protein YxjI